MFLCQQKDHFDHLFFPKTLSVLLVLAEVTLFKVNYFLRSLLFLNPKVVFVTAEIKNAKQKVASARYLSNSGPHGLWSS